MKLKKILPRVTIELVITLVLVVLKLKGVIDWSWWTVTCLLWIDAVIVLLSTSILFLILYSYNKINKE